MQAKLFGMVLMLALMLCPESGAAQSAPDASIKAEIVTVLDDYYRLFAEGRSDLISSRIYTAPSQSLAADSMEVSITQAEVKARFDKTFASLSAQRYARSVRDATNVCVLSPAAAIVSTRLTRFKGDGAVLERRGGTYVFAKIGSGWRIVSLIGHDPDNMIKCAAD